MKLPAILLGLFGIAILALTVLGAAAGFAFHVGSKLIFGTALLVCGLGVFIGKSWGFLWTPIVLMLFVGVEAYRSVRGFALFPEAILAGLGVVVLISYFIVDGGKPRRPNRPSI